MPKMPHSREHHGQAVFIAGLDGVGVAHRAAGLHHGGDARFGGHETNPCRLTARRHETHGDGAVALRRAGSLRPVG